MRDADKRRTIPIFVKLVITVVISSNAFRSHPTFSYAKKLDAVYKYARSKLRSTFSLGNGTTLSDRCC